jgi:hypothetical protein
VLPRFIVRFRLSFFLILLCTSAALTQIQAQDWVPQGISSLGQDASSRTEFTLDHSMLVLASKMDQDNQDLRRVIAGVDGVSVHRFRFQAPGMYDPQVLDSVRQQYHAAGWQHVAGAHDKNGGPGATDLWFHFEHNAIRNVAVLLVGRDQVNFFSVSGSISPIDLLHLAGHFGIPRIEGGIVVPAPGAGQQQPAPEPSY